MLIKNLILLHSTSTIKYFTYSYFAYGMDITEAEDIKKRRQEYTEELYKKDLHIPGCLALGE